MQLEELVKLIEDRADNLSELMVRNIRESPRMASYHRFSDQELGERARLVYANLGVWLEKEAEARVMNVYSQIGRVRCQERIPLSQLVWGLLLTRRTLWQFVEDQGWETVTDLETHLELELLVVRFFDRAILHAVSGYEETAGGPSSHGHAEEGAFWPGG